MNHKEERNEDGTLTEAAFTKMIEGALAAHNNDRGQGAEQAIHAVLEKLASQANGGGGLIALPDGRPVRLNMPSAQDLGLLIIQAMRVVLQTQRITLVALNDMDTRVRKQIIPKADTQRAES